MIRQKCVPFWGERGSSQVIERAGTSENHIRFISSDDMREYRWKEVWKRKKEKIYRLSILMPVNSCATDLISFTPKAVCTCSISSWVAASHI